MKVNPAPFLEELKGRLGQHVIKKRGTSTTLERKSVPYSLSGMQPSEDQVRIRDRYREKIETWKAATPEERDAWNREGKNLLLSGFNYLVMTDGKKWQVWDPIPIAYPQVSLGWLSYGEYLVLDEYTLFSAYLQVRADEETELDGISLPTTPPDDLQICVYVGVLLSMISGPPVYNFQEYWLTSGDPSLYLLPERLFAAGEILVVWVSGFYRNIPL